MTAKFLKQFHFDPKVFTITTPGPATFASFKHSIKCLDVIKQVVSHLTSKGLRSSMNANNGTAICTYIDSFSDIPTQISIGYLIDDEVYAQVTSAGPYLIYDPVSETFMCSADAYHIISEDGSSVIHMLGHLRQDIGLEAYDYRTYLDDIEDALVHPIKIKSILNEFDHHVFDRDDPVDIEYARIVMRCLYYLQTTGLRLIKSDTVVPSITNALMSISTNRMSLDKLENIYNKKITLMDMLYHVTNTFPVPMVISMALAGDVELSMELLPPETRDYMKKTIDKREAELTEMIRQKAMYMSNSPRIKFPDDLKRSTSEDSEIPNGISLAASFADMVANGTLLSQPSQDAILCIQVPQNFKN